MTKTNPMPTFDPKDQPYRLLNLHEILSVARMDRDGEEEGCNPDVPLIAGCYRIEPELKLEAERICESNNATLSQFLRGCVRTLILEYRGHTLLEA